ncbi:hypothetical protein BDV25DRAFT_18106 [Aspergillus avenaceus]|uniref:Uncharacterized protein n=1 Tax=Aspergillus avenaceus TaxID=36643 RepID=A0A5N6U533_ASPAV|nr:hypothetical protein BDV25DRAFT_18106 [Aspergillus avenaceus]
MTMSLVRFHLSLCLRHLATLPHGTPGPLGEAQSQYELDRRVEHYIDETLDTVERQYLRHCQVCEPTQKVTLALGRLGEYKTRLIVYHRFLKGRESTGDDSRWGPNRKRAMEIAKDLITAYQDLLADPSIRRFHWHIRRHSQLHGMMHILNELSAVDTLKLPPDVHMLCQCAWETIADVSMMSDISQRQTEQDERLWGFLRNLRERVRHRLYTQGFIDGTPLPSAALDDEMNLTFGQMSGADLLESLFDGQGIYFAPSADMPDL